MKILSHDEVLATLKKKQADLSVRQFAEKIGVSTAYLYDVFSKSRQPGKKILKLLGLGKESTRSTIYFERNGR